ncbi:Pimeloyl-ACP methyl ester carboxylesterase [Williamsia sterculiae]|uniref:Pimeloyl-ACP methyl ester carboxylesterase n=2 Tax=Williamsia sterculiae TaxID=1344003 RepID=A0A1N7H3Q7_9NOCA|nr:Pimeloyl-ACP methyl ester carboxylesterase [Williamsia sterculiae]
MEPLAITTRLGIARLSVVGSGTPTVFWHSLFVDARMWDRLLPLLPSGRSFWLVEAPSDRVGDIGDCAEVASEVVERIRRTLGVDSVDWVGNAWGGHVGMHIAATRPDLVRSLVAISAPTDPIGAGLRWKIRALLPIYRLIGPRGPINATIEETVFTDASRAHDPYAVDVLRSALRALGRSRVIASIRTAALNRTDLTWAARRLRCPTVFVVTDDRGEWSPERAQEVAAEMSAVDVVTITGARIIPALEQPEALASALTEFWSRAAVAGR